jgi:hypothetical protein
VAAKVTPPASDVSATIMDLIYPLDDWRPA